MMFGNPYVNYNYQQPMMQPMDQLAQLRAMQGGQQPQQIPPQAPQPQSGITWVQGEEGAKAYLVAAGNSVMLMDSEAQTFYLKSTDASGMPLPLRIFDYSERTAQPKTAQTSVPEYVTREEFNSVAAKLDKLARDLGEETEG